MIMSKMAQPTNSKKTPSMSFLTFFLNLWKMSPLTFLHVPIKNNTICFHTRVLAAISILEAGLESSNSLHNIHFGRNRFHSQNDQLYITKITKIWMGSITHTMELTIYNVRLQYKLLYKNWKMARTR